MEFLKAEVKFYCINLERRADRRQRCQKIADDLGIELEFIAAVDGSKSEIFDSKEYNRKIRNIFYEPLKGGEIACCLSHLKAYEKFLSSDAEFAVILEDDFCPEKEFLPFINQLANGFTGWEAVRLQRSKKQEGLKLVTIEGYEVIFPLRVGLTTTACMYTREGARKAKRIYQSFFLPADEAMKFCHLYGLNMCELNPKLVSQHNDSSDIAGGFQRPPKSKAWVLRKLISISYIILQGLRLLIMPITFLKFKKNEL